MPLFELYLDLYVDGARMEQIGFPMTLRATRAEFQAFNYLEPNDGNDTTFSALPVEQVATLRDLLATAIDQAIGIRLEGGEAGNIAIRLSANGLVLVFNGTITATNVTVNNNSGQNARLRGFGAG